MSLDLKRLAEPFAEGDVEWRVSRSGNKQKGGIWCKVLAYITARAISNRLDEVVGPENWCNTPLQVHEVRTGIWALQVGISIRINNEWITKYDVAESTDIEPAKGGFSSAMKRAGAQWGIGRYLYLLDETFAETSDSGGPGWNDARLPEKAGGDWYYWKPPKLPAWALPPVLEGEKPVTQKELNELKTLWCEKMAPGVKNRQQLQEGFTTFVHSYYGSVPVDALTCWTRTMLEHCTKVIEATKDPKGPPPTVPF